MAYKLIDSFSFLDSFRGTFFSGEWPTVSELFLISRNRFPDSPFFTDFEGSGGSRQTLTYNQVYENASRLASWLIENGLEKGDRIAVTGKNSPEWGTAFLAGFLAGSVVCPMDYGLSEKELENLIATAKPKFVFADEEKLPHFEKSVDFRTISLSCKKNPQHLYNLCGKKNYENRCTNENDLAVILFTSGTTGTPKGVMLSHGNIICQLDEVTERIYLNPGERALLVLPVWHAFQRAIEYVVLCQGATLCYSKPIGSVILQDLVTLNPYLLPAVPRVWTAVYDGIWRKMRKTGGLTYAMFRFFVNASILWCRIDRKLRRKNTRFGGDWLGFWWPVLVLPWLLLYPPRLLGKLLVFRKIRRMVGKNFRAGVAGGGAFPENVDEFFWSIGIKIVEGYGLTETAPIVCVRPIVDPIFRNVGSPFRGIQARVVDDDGIILGKCKKGNLQIKGACVMKGYYKRPDLTEKVMTVDGWFDTGDIAILSVNNEIQLRGRKKDTIVLLGGENIEPLPIESKINESMYISTSVVFGTNDKGEDQRYLVALILPEKDAVETFARENGLTWDSYEALLETDKVRKFLENEVFEAVSAKNGFKSFERINKIEFITKPFEVGVELSAKQEMRRHLVAEEYKEKLAKMYNS